YVRGHLLNRHLGGPGLDYNMVPLTGRAGWFGANNANGAHSSEIEETVKQKYGMMKPGSSNPVSNLIYKVEAKDPKKRPQTKDVYDLTDQFNGEAERLLKEHAEEENASLE